MAIYLTTVTFDHDSGLPENQIVNTWHVSGDLNGGETLIAASFADFYGEAATGQLNTIMARMSSVLTGTGVVRMYDLADVVPRVPILEYEFAGFTPGGTALPSEVACCLSFKAAPVAGVNAARRRNRVYIGPLAESARISGTEPRPLGTFRADLFIALQNLKDEIETHSTGLATLVGYSPTDGIPWTIAEAWSDDAFDTQRRRGEDATSRMTATIT